MVELKQVGKQQGHAVIFEIVGKNLYIAPNKEPLATLMERAQARAEAVLRLNHGTA